MLSNKLDGSLPHILVVDDQEENLDSIDAILSGLRVKLHLVSSGEEALEKIKQHKFALIILDVVMPGMGGFEVAEKLNRDGITKDTPIIFVSALSNNENYVYRGYECGAVDFLFKPFNAYILKSKVEVFLNLHENQMRLRSMVKLEQEKEDLKRSNRDLVQFANVTSHDLRSPLTRVISFTKILLDNPKINEDEEAKACVEKIRDSSERMDLLIKSLLTYAKTDQVTTEVEDIDINSILKNVLADLDFMISSNGAHIQVDKISSIPGHDVLVRQLFQNIISNCLKFKHPERQLNITIRECPSEKDQNMLLAISDNGIGFDSKKSDSIFQPFIRLDQSKHIEGSGLGLATVKRIMEIHRGRVWAESQEGHGTTFYLSFPKVIDNNEQKRQEARQQLEEKSVELFCLNNAGQSYQMMLVDESSRGYGGKYIGKNDLHVGKILTFHEQQYKVCWILEFSEGAYRLGLSKVEHESQD